MVVADGRKSIENRPRRTNITEEVLIHASLTYNKAAEESIRQTCRNLRLPEPTLEDLRSTPRGAIIGTMTIVACVTPKEVPHRHRRWASGPWCYLISDSKVFHEPIPWKGALGFFNVPDKVVAGALRSAKRGRYSRRRPY
jgi:hypothetical protein